MLGSIASFPDVVWRNVHHTWRGVEVGWTISPRFVCTTIQTRDLYTELCTIATQELFRLSIMER